MKKISLLVCLTVMLFGFRSYATIGITIATGLPSDTICSGTTVTFTATPDSSAYGYIWKLNGVAVGSSAPTYTTSSLLTGVNKIFCVLTNAAGDTIYAISDTLSITVDTLPANAPIAGPMPTNVCIGDTINLTDAATGGVWVSANPTSATVSAIGTVTGISLPTGGGGGGGGFGGPSVRIYYILTNSCGSDSSRIRVTVDAPAGPITLASNTICLDSTIFITDTAGGGTWLSSDSTVASFAVFGGFAPPFGILTANTTGTTTITYSGANACGSFSETANITVVNCDSTSSVPNIVSIANSCHMFPNPSTGIINVVANSAKYNTANCTITNVVGEQVKVFTISTNKETELNLGVSAGVYFITVSAGEEKYTGKIVVMQ